MVRSTHDDFIAQANASYNRPIKLYVVHDYLSDKISSSATSTSANHLVDSTTPFVAGDVGKTIHNTTDKTNALITAFNSASDVTISKDIMENGETYDMETDLFYTDNNENVTYDTFTYITYPIACGSISENTKGEISGLSLTISNVLRIIIAYILSNDLRRKQVDIITVFYDTLNNITANIKDTYFINSYIADQKNVNINLSPKYDLMDLVLPLGVYSRNHCRWIFKSSECGYAGAETTCNKTLSDCKDNKSNSARFGGFPSIPSRRIMV